MYPTCTLHLSLSLDDTEYNEKLELGRTIHKITKEYNINEVSICKEYKEALDLFMKQTKKTRNIDPDNVC